MKTQHWETWHYTNSLSLGEGAFCCHWPCELPAWCPPQGLLNPVSAAELGAGSKLQNCSRHCRAALARHSLAPMPGVDRDWEASGPWWAKPSLVPHPPCAVNVTDVSSTAQGSCRLRPSCTEHPVSLLPKRGPTDVYCMLEQNNKDLSIKQWPLEHTTHAICAVLSFPIFLPFSVAIFQS